MRTTATLLAGLALAGCSVAENDRGTLGRGLTIEAIADAPPPEVALTEDQPLTLDRAEWPILRYEAPVDSTLSYPTYRLFAGYPGEIGRQWGDYPSELSSLDLEGDDVWLRHAESWAAPFWAAAEIAALPVTVVLMPPWENRLSPGWDYQRQPRRGAADVAGD